MKDILIVTAITIKFISKFALFYVIFHKNQENQIVLHVGKLVNIKHIIHNSCYCKTQYYIITFYLIVCLVEHCLFSKFLLSI